LRVYNELLSEVILLKVNLSKNNSDIAATTTTTKIIIIIIIMHCNNNNKIKRNKNISTKTTMIMNKK
jgi:uncharacterized membrane protein